LAVVLLAGTGLFVRGLQRFTHRDPGWKVDGLLTARLNLPPSKYSSNAHRQAFFKQLNERLQSLPGVERAALSWSIPIWAFATSGTFSVEDHNVPVGQEPNRFLEAVTPEYFDTLGIRLRQGRAFTSADATNAPAVAIINEAMARRYWPNENPIGKRIGGTDAANPNWQEIVGVVNDVKPSGNLATPHTRLQVYRPLAQAPRSFATIVLRTAGSPNSLANALRQAVREMDPDLPVFEIGTAREQTERMLANFSLVGWMLGGSAFLGLLLAALGLYGVLAHIVAQRTNEMGIRFALGAQVRDVFWLILGSGLRVSAAGLLIGLAGAFALERLLISIAPELPVHDPAALGWVAVTLLATALVACWLPARRAAKVDPMEALRYE
jgi:predicted permease